MSVNDDRLHQPTGMFGRLILFPFLFALAYLAVQSGTFLIPFGGITRSIVVTMTVLALLLGLFSRFTTPGRAGMIILAGLALLMPTLGDLWAIASFIAGSVIGFLLVRLARADDTLRSIMARGGPLYSFVRLIARLRGWGYAGVGFLIFEVVIAPPATDPSFRVPLAEAGLLIGLLIAFQRHLPEIDHQAILMLNRGGAICLSVVMIAGLGTGRLMVDMPQSAVDCPSGIHSGPNMYVLLLDAHASEGTMARLYDYNMESFLSRLEGDGFYVDRQSHSNYDHTSETLASMLNFVPTQEQPAIAGDLVASQGDTFLPSLRNAIRYNQAFDLLHCAGYQIDATGGLPVASEAMTTADQWINGGQVNEIEINLLDTFHILPIIQTIDPYWLDNQQRDRISQGLANTIKLAQTPTTTPRFVWAHLLSPHMPAVFDADGGPPLHPNTVRGGYFQGGIDLTIDSKLFIQAYRAQLDYLDKQVASTVEQIAVADPTAVIVIFSDHGPGNDFFTEDPVKSDLGERFGNLFAVRTPGVSSLYSSPVTPLNILGPLFNQYLGTSIARQPDSTWFGPYISDGKVLFPEVHIPTSLAP